MIEYVDLIKNILDNGYGKDDRTGVGNVSIVGAQMRTDLAKQFPALSVRRVAPRIAFEELMFMLNGKSQTKELEDKNINIWKGNTSKEFQKGRNLEHLEEGDFGRMYGVQLRNFVGEHPTSEEFKVLASKINFKLEKKGINFNNELYNAVYSSIRNSLDGLNW